VQHRFSKFVGNVAMVVVNNSSPVRAATQPDVGGFILAML